MDRNDLCPEMLDPEVHVDGHTAEREFRVTARQLLRMRAAGQILHHRLGPGGVPYYSREELGRRFGQREG